MHAASWQRGMRLVRALLRERLGRREAGARSLAAALHAAREGTGEVRRILLSATFRPRLPGCTWPAPS